MICAALAEHYSVASAGDGVEGLARALARPPQLIITDVMMPRMSGWELVKRVRSHSQLAFVPFIFLTALGSEEERLFGFRLGADEYLPKPIDLPDLVMRVDLVLRRLAHLEDVAREQVLRAPPEGRAGAARRPRPDRPVLAHLHTRWVPEAISSTASAVRAPRRGEQRLSGSKREFGCGGEYGAAR